MLNKKRKITYTIPELYGLYHEYRYDIILYDLLPQDQKFQNKRYNSKINNREMYPISAFVLFESNGNPSSSSSGISEVQQPTPTAVLKPFSPPDSSLTQTLQQHQQYQQHRSQIYNGYIQETETSQVSNQSSSFIIPVITIDPGSKIPPGGLHLQELYKKFPNCKIFESHHVEKETMKVSKQIDGQAIHMRYSNTNHVSNTVILKETNELDNELDYRAREADRQGSYQTIDDDAMNIESANSVNSSNTSSSDGIIIQIHPSS
ncbi:uncharacterized protein KGF55_003326 [Candida pseudojiufengensis]|uniref:uncharacterized protein n=1 Tax=Candida pseudojiufengensis TaxID=497109 RepID=UPI002225339E|nr:uncharacterized protein KGF55_003326 [Candida pseudojiufengensis]KAI5962250.1 hypothetical protein KGF55_003326 [Candida pseudojiufengensis]